MSGAYKVLVAWEEGGVDFCLSQITHAWKFRKWPEPGREKEMPRENKNWKPAFWGAHLERQRRPDGKRTNAKQMRYSQSGAWLLGFAAGAAK